MENYRMHTARRDLAHPWAPQKRIASATARSFGLRELRSEAATTQILYCTLSQNGRGAYLFLWHAVHDSCLNMILPTGWGLSHIFCCDESFKTASRKACRRFVKWRLWERATSLYL
jgi:hypothetical protein